MGLPAKGVMPTELPAQRSGKAHQTLHPQKPPRHQRHPFTHPAELYIDPFAARGMLDVASSGVPTRFRGLDEYVGRWMIGVRTYTAPGDDTRLD